ncbi:ImuA family protein [Tateyamaria omphalii]|uniref:Protein ImuA n=1 Tax=Tateyamaria omphalii TaxID=299262 RepID=A0A1P8MV01_9RHOB|nr:hypothetical protein [Tateyamaria omphalii]APX11927.1 hypothetical protein BWR18_09750 [Tateyamaria omphalii]
MPLPTALTHRTHTRTAPCLPLLPEGAQHGLGDGLALGRVHEACGPARHRFALWLAAQTTGPVIWITTDWNTESLNPCGFAPIVDPARLLLVHARRPEDVLWSMEEVLRSGTVPLAIADLPGLPGLTPVRRMHLAAENGAAGKGDAPLGLLLTPGMGGAQGVESRWHLATDHKGAPGRWTLTRLRARTAPERAWNVTRQPGQPLPRVSGSINAA